jgi:(1->4)-alpha-D-glucan 1-alpha-D-glucosylmutase
MMKAVRESKTRTSWTESDEQYEKALTAFVSETLAPSDDAHFLPDVARLTALTANAGFLFSLARILLHFTAPGAPDIYQGDELWNFALVDPDNRRPVDFQRRARLLSECESTVVLRKAFTHESSQPEWSDDAVKLALTSRLLHFRRDHVALLRDGEYVALLTDAAPVDHVFAFARRSGEAMCIAMARTRAPHEGNTESPTASLPADLAGGWQSVLTGRAIELVRDGGHVLAKTDELIAQSQPCELLLRTNR